jgi:hypothetical protein
LTDAADSCQHSGWPFNLVWEGFIVFLIMSDIIKDITDIHWWFNITVGILVIAIGYVINEFGIKPLLQAKTTNIRNKRAKIKESLTVESNDILRIKSDQREEMRMLFDLTHIRQQMFLILFIIVLNVPGILCAYFIGFWPMKIAVGGFCLWVLIKNFIEFVRLMHAHNNYLNILQKVQKD